MPSKGLANRGRTAEMKVIRQQLSHDMLLHVCVRVCVCVCVRLCVCLVCILVCVVVSVNAYVHGSVCM
jgi:hypothetical protein